MGALDILAQVVKDHEAKKAYGTPFYKEKLAQLAQQQEAGDLANQLAQFKLTNEQDLAPIQKQILEATLPAKEAAAGKIGAETKKIEAQTGTIPSTAEAANALKLAQAALANAKGPAAQLAAQAAMTRAQAAMHKALNPTAPSASFSPISTTDQATGEAVQGLLNRKTGEVGPMKVNGASQFIAAKPSGQEALHSQYFNSSLQAMNGLEQDIADLKKARASGDVKTTLEKAETFKAHLKASGDLFARAAGAARPGSTQQNSFAALGGISSDLINIADPDVALRRLQDGRKFLQTIQPAHSKFGLPNSDASNNDPLGIR